MYIYEYEIQMLESNLVNGQIRQRIESENEVYQSNEFYVDYSMYDSNGWIEQIKYK